MEKIDTVSQLPDEILHHILSFLSIEQAFRTSLLSRRWNGIWTTLPYLTVHTSYKRSYHQVLDFIERTLVNRGSTHDTCIQRFHLLVESYDDDRVPDYIERWVERLAQDNIQEIVMSIKWNWMFRCFPQAILSAKSVTMLHLSGSTLRDADNVELISLRNLTLTNIRISDSLIQKILATSLNLEELSLDCCHGVTCIALTGLVMLKLFRLRYNEDLKWVEIDAPNLERFVLTETLSEIKYMNCSNLRKMALSLHFVTDEGLSERLSTFMNHLEYLKIYECDELKSPVISSSTLTVLEICNCDRLSKVEINAPNLQSLKLFGKKIFSVSIKAPPKMKVELHFDLTEMGLKEYIDLLGLLLDLSGSESMTLFINVPNTIIPEEWKTHFVRMEYVITRVRDLFLGTNIPLLDGIQMKSLGGNIQRGEPSTTSTCHLRSSF